MYRVNDVGCNLSYFCPIRDGLGNFFRESLVPLFSQCQLEKLILWFCWDTLPTPRDCGASAR